MKIFSILIMVTVLVAGCGQKPESAKLKELEMRVSSLQEKIDSLENKQKVGIKELWDQEKLVTTALDSCAKELTMHQEAIEKIIHATLTLATNNISTITAIQKQQNPSVQYNRPSGPTPIPASVMAKIREDAARRWANDYDMQVFAIKQQTEAWHKLNP